MESKKKKKKELNLLELREKNRDLRERDSVTLSLA